MAREWQSQFKGKWEPEHAGGRNNKFGGPRGPPNKKVNIAYARCGKCNV